MGAGWWRCGGAWRMGLTALPPGCPWPDGGGKGTASPWHALNIPRAEGGGRGGRGGGGSRRGSSPPPSGPLARSPGGCGGWLEAPGPGPLHGRQRGAARPPLPRARPGLFGILGRRARPGWPPVGQSGGGGGGGRLVCRPPSGARLGGPGGRGVGGRSASVRPSASLRRVPKRASPALPSPWRAWPPYCTGSRPRAAA